MVPGPQRPLSPPSPTKLAALTSSSSHVKNTDEAKAFLGQRALLAINNNYTAETLVNILQHQCPQKQTPWNNLIKAVGFLIIHKVNVNISTEITSAILKQLPTLNQSVTNGLKHECDFIKATTSEQSKSHCNFLIQSRLSTQPSPTLTPPTNPFYNRSQELLSMMIYVNILKNGRFDAKITRI